MNKAKIFLVSEQTEHLVPMVEEYFSNEEILQLLLEKYPDLIPGDQISPESPLRWLLVAREMGVPGEKDEASRWSLDHLFLDQAGIPTFVECKRSVDTRTRREVVAQMLDYAANGVEYWSMERLRQSATETAQRHGRSIDDEILELISSENEEDIDLYWKGVEQNLRLGKIRLIFVTENTPKELRRLVEFLNDKMDDVEVLVVEIKQYVSKGQKAIVPRVLGITEAARSKKKVTNTKTITQTEFLESCSPEAGEFFKKVIDQAQIRGHNIYWGTLGFSVRAYLPNLDRYISFVYGFPVDDFQFYLGYLPLPENELYSLRQEMLNFGIFREGGKKTLKSKLTGDNLEKAPLVYSFILDMMDKIIKK